MSMALTAMLCFSSAGCALFKKSGVSDSNMEMPIEIIAPNGEVFPYIDDAKLYLLAPAGMDNVKDYCAPFGGCLNPNKPITLKWECESKENITSITLEYGLANAENPVKVALSGDAKSYDLYNLYKASEYVWSVTAQSANGKQWTMKSSFTTTDFPAAAADRGGIVAAEASFSAASFIMYSSAVSGSMLWSAAGS